MNTEHHLKKFDVIINGTLQAMTPISFTQPLGNGSLPKIGQKLYIPASSLRGKLRRLARDVVYEANNNEPMPLEDFYFLTLGGIKNGKAKNEEGKEVEIDKHAVTKVMAVRQQNPMVSLFGAMAPQAIGGRLSVSHLIAKEVINPDTVKHVRTNDLVRNPEVVEMLDGNALSDYNAMKSVADIRSALTAEKRDLNRTKKNLSSEELADANAKIKAIDEQLKDVTVVQVGLPQLEYEVIPQGAVLGSNFRLMGATEVEIVLFMKALAKFAENPVLGGRINHGLGEVKGQWDISFREVGGKMQTAGTLSFDGDFMPAKTEGKVTEWLETEFNVTDMNFTAALAA